MPARQPFTALCRAAARRHTPSRVDLHLHSTHSDGAYTPAQIVDLASRSGLAAIAITDHDSIAAIAPARAAVPEGLEIVPGVEISAEDRGQTLHILGYFFRPDDAALGAALGVQREHRRIRFQVMRERLRQRGLAVADDDLQAEAVGRRHLAQLLVQAGRCATIREAFGRYLNDQRLAPIPLQRMSVCAAIALIRGAGGVASWAHPPYDGIRQRLPELRALGLQALEVDYPSHTPGRVRELRALAAEARLLVTGGSDCHGPDSPKRAIGMRGVTTEELEALRALSRS